MWAICGSVGFAAPCASASPVPITSAASAAPNLNASMVLSSEREPKSIRTPLDARRRERFPEFRDNAVGHALAAQVAERKGLAERRAEPFHDRGAEQHAGAEEPGLHRLGLEAEDLRGFLDAHLLEQTSDDDPAKRRRQLVDRLLQHVPELVVGHRPLGVRQRGRRRERYHMVRPLSAQPLQRGIDDDATEPGLEARLAAKAADIAKGA